ncbi:MAG: LptF/LptG family permease [Waddliaceae bacterium]
MIPIIWRFLISQYLKMMGLCVVAFISVLLITRLDDVAHFCALGASGNLIALFVLYQIPYVLPIAIPVACLISAILLVQQLSKTHELTALRACGISINNFLAPILFVAAFLSLINFYVVSELATVSHFSSNLWKSELRAINPLLLLRNKHLMRMKGAYFHALGPSRIGESASKAVMAMPNKSNGRINLLLAENLFTDHDLFHGEGLTLITTIPAKKEDGFDHLMIENMENSATTPMDFSQLLQLKAWKVNHDHLQMKLLLSRLKEEKMALQKAKTEGNNETKAAEGTINRCYSEIIRRLSVAFAAFTFTLLGASFGIKISRHASYWTVFYVVGLAALYLAAYFMARGIDHLLILSTLTYLLPHGVLIGLSIWVLRRAAKGIE